MKTDTLTLRDAASGRLIQTIKMSERKETIVSLKESLAMAKSGMYTSQTPVRSIRLNQPMGASWLSPSMIRRL